MIECSQFEAIEGLAINLECTKMKDDEPFKEITALLEKVELDDGRSSLVVAKKLKGKSNAGGGKSQLITELLRGNSGETGATNKELWDASVKAGIGSKSSFLRALKDLKNAGEIREVGEGKGKKYYLAGVSVKEVSA